ncbi:MAG: AAA family ATPase [Peptococcaceae bacterium]|nr:AAA family ATPase [Peptococcaceae bacterium]
MLKKFFRKKDNGPRPEEDFVLWKAGGGEAQPEEESKTEALKMFNLPVSPKALAGHGKIIAVQGAVGGDGATTVAVNLAGLLALSNPERVVLMDLDGYGAVRSRMGLPAGECLVNILDWEDIYGPKDMARGLLNHSSGIMAVPGVIHYDQVEKVTPALVLKMLTLLKESHDYIVLDCPPAGINNNTWVASLVADIILTVFRPDRASIDLLQENNGFMHRLGCQDRVNAVLNQAGIPGGIRPGDLESRLGVNIIGILPYSPGVAEANNRRQIIVHARQRDDFTRAMQALADRMTA